MTCSSYQPEFFILSLVCGIILALLFVPSLSDKYGRKSIFCVSLIISVIAQLGLVLVDQQNIAFALLAIIGVAWPGKMIVGLSYGLEFFSRK